MFDLRRLLFDKHREWKKVPDWVKEEYCQRTGREIPMEIPDWYEEIQMLALILFSLLGPVTATSMYNRWILHLGPGSKIFDLSFIVSMVTGLGLAVAVMAAATHIIYDRHETDPGKIFRRYLGSIRWWLNFLPRGYESLWDEFGRVIPKEKLKAEVEGYLGMLGAAVVGYESIKGYERNPELKSRHDEIRAILMNCCERAANCILPPGTKGTSFLKL